MVSAKGAVPPAAAAAELLHHPGPQQLPAPGHPAEDPAGASRRKPHAASAANRGARVRWMEEKKCRAPVGRWCLVFSLATDVVESLGPGLWLSQRIWGVKGRWRPKPPGHLRGGSTWLADLDLVG